MSIPPGNRQILRLTRLQIGHHRLHRAGIGRKGIIIKRHQLIGDGLIGKLQAKIAVIGGLDKIPHAHVAGVVGEGGQQLQVPAALPGKVAHAIGNSGGNPHRVIRQGHLRVQ